MSKHTCLGLGSELTARSIERRQVRSGSRLLKWLERMLLTGGAAALGWCAFVLSDAYLVQQSGRAQLESLRRARAASTLPPESTVPVEALPSSEAAPEEPPVETRSSLSVVVRPKGNPRAVLAELSIPRLGFSAVVFRGSDDYTLRSGLGHVENTPLPGETGNVAIAGHRDSFFRSLHNLREDDDIWVDTVDQRVHYRVKWFRVVSPREVSVIAPTSEQVLTLVTCFPFQFLGRAPYRFVVRATRVDDPTAVPPPAESFSLAR